GGLLDVRRRRCDRRPAGGRLPRRPRLLPGRLRGRRCAARGRPARLGQDPAGGRATRRTAAADRRRGQRVTLATTRCSNTVTARIAAATIGNPEAGTPVASARPPVPPPSAEPSEM